MCQITLTKIVYFTESNEKYIWDLIFIFLKVNMALFKGI